jgi:hypothetical protein
MTFLQLINAARQRAGVKKAALTTVVAATGMDADLVMWVQDAWRDLQRESENWWFRQKLDQTLAMVASTDEYAMPTGLIALNWRTVTCYFTASGTDESNVEYVPYEDWRMAKDTVTSSEGRPIMITEKPDGVLAVWPVPDKIYTIRFDGVYDVDEMTADADTPGDTISGGTQLLPDRFHYCIVWDAVARYAAHHQDMSTLERAQKYLKVERGLLSERSAPPVYIKAGQLTGRTNNQRYNGWRY